jgi:membrane-associated protease RseP (regulator of RpoE activity)
MSENSYHPLDPGGVPPEWHPPEIITAEVVSPPPWPVPPPPPPLRRGWKMPLALFVATCLSTFYAGGWSDTGPFNVAEGLIYSACLMTILVCHEAGHFIQARRYGVYATYPYFLPMPVPPLGTLGAVIAMGSRIKDRKALFDIGISGPLAGLVPALVFSIVGLKASTIVDSDTFMRAIESGTSSSLALGNSILFGTLTEWLRPEPPGQMLSLSPMAMAGWVGLLITALNLIPIGQLDGGHVLYALIRRRAHLVATALLMVGAGWVTWEWLTRHNPSFALMIVLLILIGPRHPPTANDYVPLGATRKVLGWATLAFLVVGFTPYPFQDMQLQRRPSRPPHRRHALPEGAIEVRFERLEPARGPSGVPGRNPQFCRLSGSRAAQLGRAEDAVAALVDRERPGCHAHVNVVNVGQLGGYSPRVPAGETSPIGEAAFGGHLALVVGDLEFRRGGIAPLDRHGGTLFAAAAD